MRALIGLIVMSILSALAWRSRLRFRPSGAPLQRQTSPPALGRLCPALSDGRRGLIAE